MTSRILICFRCSLIVAMPLCVHTNPSVCHCCTVIFYFCFSSLTKYLYFLHSFLLHLMDVHQYFVGYWLFINLDDRLRFLAETPVTGHTLTLNSYCYHSSFVLEKNVILICDISCYSPNLIAYWFDFESEKSAKTEDVTSCYKVSTETWNSLPVYLNI